MDPHDGVGVDLDRLGDPFVRLGRPAFSFVGFEQDAGGGALLGLRRAGCDQAFRCSRWSAVSFTGYSSWRTPSGGLSRAERTAVCNSKMSYPELPTRVVSSSLALALSIDHRGFALAIRPGQWRCVTRFGHLDRSNYLMNNIRIDK
jgi:hypothetical protein